MSATFSKNLTSNTEGSVIEMFYNQKMIDNFENLSIISESGGRNGSLRPSLRNFSSTLFDVLKGNPFKF